jgi:hypothetical protein
MRKILFIVGLLLFTSAIAHADCDRFEVGGGYKYVRVSSLSFGLISVVPAAPAISTGSGSINLNGWTAEVAVNPACWLGIVGNFNGVYGSQGGGSGHVYTETFGPRVNLHKSGPINPFVEALFGAAQFGGGGTSFNAFAGEYGGGVDISLGPTWAIRGRIDDESTHFASQFQNSLGVAAEIVFKFGGGH